MADLLTENMCSILMSRKSFTGKEILRVLFSSKIRPIGE